MDYSKDLNESIEIVNSVSSDEENDDESFTFSQNTLKYPTLLHQKQSKFDS
jgi:hypothetical protein